MGMKGGKGDTDPGMDLFSKEDIDSDATPEPEPEPEPGIAKDMEDCRGKAESYLVVEALGPGSPWLMEEIKKYAGSDSSYICNVESIGHILGGTSAGSKALCNEIGFAAVSVRVKLPWSSSPSLSVEHVQGVIDWLTIGRVLIPDICIRPSGFSPILTGQLTRTRCGNLYSDGAWCKPDNGKVGLVKTASWSLLTEYNGPRRIDRYKAVAMLTTSLYGIGDHDAERKKHMDFCLAMERGSLDVGPPKFVADVCPGVYLKIERLRPEVDELETDAIILRVVKDEVDIACDVCWSHTYKTWLTWMK